jgi:predicted Zn-dependent protease
MHDLLAKDLERQFGIPPSLVRSLRRAGHIRPARHGAQLRYSFQDLIVLRTAKALRAAKIPARKINSSLKRLRASLPSGMPLSGLAITALGDRIAVREGPSLWDSESGQYVLALEVAVTRGGIQVIDRRAHPPAPRHSTPQDSDGYYQQALAIEEQDAAAARSAYEASLRLDPEHIEARINLGRLLHLAGELNQAERVYRTGDQQQPLLVFNLAVLLEDLEREDEAISAYRSALVLDPQLADAHFNLARLYQQASNAKESLRHLLAYRRLLNK